MGLLEKLKGLKGLKDLVKINLKDFLKIQVNNYHITVNNQSPAIEVKDQKTIQLNISKFVEEQDKSVEKAIKEAIEEEGFLLIEKSAQETLEDFKKIDSSEESKRIVKTLESFISTKDIEILRASLYLRKKFEERKSGIQDLKNDIVAKFGDRGRKIANLCSAGYFEKKILPLLEEMKLDPSFKLGTFQSIFDTIIEEHGFAVFVPDRMKEEEVLNSIDEKIRTNKKYGLQHLNIHGIGPSNIKKIRKGVESLLSNVPGLEKTFENKIGNTIYIRLQFQPLSGQPPAQSM